MANKSKLERRTDRVRIFEESTYPRLMRDRILVLMASLSP